MRYTTDQTRVLCAAIRDNAHAMTAENDPGQLRRMDVSELLKALARILEGKSVHDSFGAPGSWGYDTPIGKALQALYRCENAAIRQERKESIPSVDHDCEVSDADPGL